MSRTNPLSNFMNSASVIQRNLYQNQININTSLERLSSGLRLNSAADGPVDYALANKFKTQLIGTKQAIGNTELSMNLVDTASNGAQSVLSNLQRIRELTIQGNSDTSTNTERDNIQGEINTLVKNIDRIVNQTNFNNRQLLDGSSSGFRSFEQAGSSILENFTYTSNTTGNRFDFLTGNIQVDQNVDVDDTIQFQTRLDTATNIYSLEVRSANYGTLNYYNDIADSPFTFNLSLPTASGTGNVSIARAPYDFERITGPLTNAELNKPLQQLVNNDRISPINYGTLSLSLGPNTHNISVSSTSTLQSFLNDLNALDSGPNDVTASYNFGTGKITLDYTGQAQNTSSTTTSYTVPDPASAGGPYADFASMPAAAQGPAYRDISLPATGFSVSSPPANFPSLPAALDTSVNYTGTDASISSAFGFSDAANAGTVTAYSSEFYGETVATATDSEYVNRTRAVITDVTAEQSDDGTDTGLTAADANTSFEILNTAQVTAASFVAGDFSIDFGANGVYTFSGFDPNTDSINDIVSGINGFAGANVTANYDNAADTLTINNTPPSVTQPKVTDPGLVAGNISIDFGDNGVFSAVFDPNTQSIQDIEDTLNAFNPGNVTANYNAGTDSFSISNTAAIDNRIEFSAGAESDALRQFFKLNNLASSGGGLQSINSGSDIDNSSIDPILDITDPAAQTLTQLTTPIAIPQDNRIEFGGANGAAVANFFKLSDAGDSGSGVLQSIASSGAIDNGSIDASLELSDTSLSLQALRTPKLDTLVSGNLNINGENIINIDASTNTINDVVNAINTFSPAGNLDYSADFDGGVSGGIRITASDTETLAAAGSQPAATPSGASPTITGNQLTLDSAAYFATGAPVFEQTAYAATPLTPNAQNTPYVTVNPTVPNVSDISFGGSTNIASVLSLNNASSGASTVIGDEFQGTATATSHNTYDLTGDQRRTFEASSSTTSTQRLGFDTSAIDENDIPEDGIIGEVRIVPQTRFRSENNALHFQVGAQEGNQIRLDIADLSARDLRLEGLNVFQSGDDNTQIHLRAENALNIVDKAIESTLTAGSELGASQNVLNYQLNHLEQEREIVSQSLSDTQDADITQEIVDLTRAQINTQVGAAVLAENRAETRDLYDVLFGSNLGINNFFNKT